MGVLGLVAAPAAFAAPTPPKSVTPSVSCFIDNGDGTVTVTVDVTNANATAATLNYGPANRIQPDPDDQGQPTVFAPGTTSNAWSGTFTSAQLATAKWHLDGNNVSLQTSTECGATDVPAQGSAIAVVALGAVTTLIGAALMGERRRRNRLHQEVE
jgi:hypothetical protein